MHNPRSNACKRAMHDAVHNARAMHNAGGSAMHNALHTQFDAQCSSRCTNNACAMHDGCATCNATVLHMQCTRNAMHVAHETLT